MFLGLDFDYFIQVGTYFFYDLRSNQPFVDATIDIGRLAHYIKSEENAVSVLSFCTFYGKTEKPHQQQSFRVLDPK